MTQERDWQRLTSDYVLGLLTAEEARAFEARTAVDEQLRQAVLAERALLTAVQETLHTVSAPTPRVLHQRPVPPRRLNLTQVALWLKPLAITAVLALLMLGSFGLGTQNTAVAAPITTAHAQTAVPEKSPTLTLHETQTRPAAVPHLVSTVAPSPNPHATPIVHLAPQPDGNE